MADQAGSDDPTVARPAKPVLDKAARRAERARINRLSRLPLLYDYAEQGKVQSRLSAFAQVTLILVAVLVPARLLTGDFLPAGVGLVVLAAAFALQALNRYLNAKAGRR